jgi:hypothetical protein
MSDATHGNSPTSTATPMELDFNLEDDRKDDEDQGIGNSNKNSNTSEEDLSDPEDSSREESDDNNSNGYKLQGPARLQRKKDTNERRSRDNRSATRNSKATPPQESHSSYRVQIKLGTVKKIKNTQ